jgi:dephospho-CoA kinase
MNISHNKFIIIGLAGTFASGKDSLARYLEERFSIKHISTGDIVREFAQEQYGSVERPVLYRTANELRSQRGPSVLSEIAIERYESYKESYPGGVCISGFRAWDEARYIKDLGGTLIYTDASTKVRYGRMVSRARDNERLISFEEFIEREADENGGVNSEFSITGIKERADIVLDTDIDLQDFLNMATEALGLESRIKT